MTDKKQKPAKNTPKAPSLKARKVGKVTLHPFGQRPAGLSRTPSFVIIPARKPKSDEPEKE